MTEISHEVVAIGCEDDVVRVRTRVKAAALAIGLGAVDQAKIVTAASELARNAFVYAGGGEVRIERVVEPRRRGLRLSFSDEGPGIADVTQAMTDRFSTAGSLGLGLGGAKRLSNEFDIQSTPGVGTRVTIARWRLA